MSAAAGPAPVKESTPAGSGHLEGGSHGSALVDAMATELDHDERALYDTLDTAMAIPSAGRPQLRKIAGDPGFYRVLRPDLPGWRDVIDEALRRSVPGGGRGPMPRLAFGTEPFIEQPGRLRVFLPRADAVLMHLAHPMTQRALGILARRRHPGAGSEVSRWTVRRGGVPDGAKAIVLLSIEEKEEELRRRRHHYEEICEQLQRERTRILERLLPARFALAGSPRVFPVAVEVRLPERGS